MGGEEVVETEAEILERLKRGNTETVERIKEKKLTESFDPDMDDAIDNVSPGFSGDMKVDAELVAEELAGRAGKVYDDLDIRERMTFYDKAYKGLSANRFKNMPDPDEMATGGRVGLMAGGMGRRAFLKMIAGAGGLAAAAKTGLLNIYRGASQVKENVIETVAKTDAQGIPEHFMALVNKILKEGKITGEADRIRTYKHPTRKDIEMDLDVGNGDIDVRFETDQGAKGNYYLKRGQDDFDPDTGTVLKDGDEFIDGEEVYRFSDDGNAYVKDFEEGISTGTSNLDEFVGIKKKDFASGGIAGMLGE